jgi:hypothetical protein
MAKRHLRAAPLLFKRHHDQRLWAERIALALSQREDEPMRFIDVQEPSIVRAGVLSRIVAHPPSGAFLRLQVAQRDGEARGRAPPRKFLAAVTRTACVAFWF